MYKGDRREIATKLLAFCRRCDTNAICRILLMSFAILLRRYKQPKEHPQELPKSPIPPPSVEEYRSTPTPDYTLRSTIILPHEHLDEIREERVHLSQVFQTISTNYIFV